MIEFISDIIKEPIYILYILIFIEPFIALILYKLIKLLIQSLLRNSKITWEIIYNKLEFKFGNDFMLEVPKNEIYKYVRKITRKVRLKINFAKLVSSILIALRVIIPFFIDIPNDAAIGVLINYVSSFIYFIYLCMLIVKDRKENGDIISLKKNIKVNIFDNYTAKEDIEL